MRKQTIKPAKFDGTNRLETNGDIFGGAELPSLGFACWFKISPSSGFRVPLGLRGVLAIGIDSSNRLNSNVDTNDGGFFGVQYTTPLTNDVWYFAVCTYDKDAIGDSLNLYLNGELVDSSNQKRIPTTATNYPISVGQNAGINQFTGEVYDGLVYTQALTADQVKRLYNQGLNISASSLKHLGLDQGLICAYALDEENEGMDLSGNENHLSNINNVTFDGSAVDVLHTGIQTRTAVEFDGTNSFETTNIVDGLTIKALTVVAKVKYNKSGFRGILNRAVANSMGYYFELNDITDNLFCYVQGVGGYSPLGLSAGDLLQEGEDIHVCMRYDNTQGTGELTLFVNGEISKSASTTSGDIIFTAPTFQVGRTYDGEISNLMFYTQALTADQVKWLYNKGFGRDPYLLPSNIKQGLLCNYPLDFKSYGKDISGNGYDLTAVNNPTATGLATQQKISNYQTGQ